MPPRPCCGGTGRAKRRDNAYPKLKLGVVEQEGGPKRFKLVTLGETSVGKTSLIMRLIRNEFNELSESTIGAAFFAHTMSLSSGQFEFDLWDTAGQERYRTLAPMYYRGSNAAIVVFDVSIKATFGRAKEWIAELRDQVPDCVVALVGNKCDLRHHAISESVAQEYADSNDLLYIETSAKTGKNVEAVFQKIGERLLKLFPDQAG